MRSFERTSEGTKVYIDEISEAAKQEARHNIILSLNQAADTYRLDSGDEVQIFFHVDRKPLLRSYMLKVGDKVSIEFLNDKDNSRVATVPPDGMINLPLIGTLRAAGKTVEALARQVQERYNQVLTEPQLTVNVTETHTPVDDLIDAIGQTSKGRTVTDKVLPDGTISVPKLPPVPARSLTLPQLTGEINKAYAAAGLDVSVSLVPTTQRPHTMFVIGEVSKPGRFDLDRPRTVLMSVAQAGGILPTGAMGDVRLFYNDPSGVEHMRSINLNDVIDDLKLEDDMIVPDNSIIYVPPTRLARTGRLLDAVLRDILRFNGVSIAGTYNLGGAGSGGSTVVPTSTK